MFNKQSKQTNKQKTNENKRWRRYEVRERNSLLWRRIETRTVTIGVSVQNPQKARNNTSHN